jgi:hypothetical protein
MGLKRDRLLAEGESAKARRSVQLPPALTGDVNARARNRAAGALGPLLLAIGHGRASEPI